MATIFTNAGATFARDALNLTTTTKPQFIGWGTGAGTAAKADTTLFTEASETSTTRVTGTVTTPAFDTFQAVGTVTATGTKTITEAGLFSAASAGSLVIHADFTGVPVLTNDAIQFTFSCQFT